MGRQRWAVWQACGSVRLVTTVLSTRNMNRSTLDPVEYLERFCAEIGVSATDHRGERAGPAAKHRAARKVKRRLFLRMYQYSGKSFVIRAYERILGRCPKPFEIDTAQHDFFEGRISRTSLMLALRFGLEGRLMRSCNIVGLSALRLFWNATHSRGRRVAPLGFGE